MDKKNEGRYRVSMDEDFESDSNDTVVKNLIGIKDKSKLDEIEAQELVNAYKVSVGLFDKDHRFTTDDICNLHKIWLEKIYSWAGELRTVNMSKDGFLFAAAAQIPRLMSEFKNKILSAYTPCNYDDLTSVIKAIAIVHVELVLIHPFRDGNGRVARLLADLMALQAGLPLLDYSEISDIHREKYFAAVRSGLDGDYEPMEKIFESIIEQSKD